MPLKGVEGIVDSLTCNQTDVGYYLKSLIYIYIYIKELINIVYFLHLECHKMYGKIIWGKDFNLKLRLIL